MASLALQAAFTLAVWQAGLLSPSGQGKPAKQHQLSPAWLFAPFAGLKRALVTVRRGQDWLGPLQSADGAYMRPCRCLCWAWR